MTEPVVLDLWGKLAEACDDVRGQRRDEDFLAYGARVRDRLKPIVDAFAAQARRETWEAAAKVLEVQHHPVADAIAAMFRARAAREGGA